MAQKLMALRLQPRQPLAEPDDTFANGAQLARSLKGHPTVQRLPCPKPVDHPLNPLYRADNHAGKEQHQHQADQKQQQRLPAKELTAGGNLLLKLLSAVKHHLTGSLHHLGIGGSEGFKAGGGRLGGAAVVALQLGKGVEILPQRLVEPLIRQHVSMGIKHVAVAFALALVDPRQGGIVKHAVLPVAAFHLQRRVGHRLAAPGIDKRGSVGARRLGAERVQALPRLPGQHQQRQQNQQKRHNDKLSQGVGKCRPAFQRVTLVRKDLPEC